ncbi:hypothetical protein NL676_009658 [Syzygium grande]|nr:hypothetical protein NL676_009658 [Syzygium grande]
MVRAIPDGGVHSRAPTARTRSASDGQPAPGAHQLVPTPISMRQRSARLVKGHHGEYRAGSYARFCLLRSEGRDDNDDDDNGTGAIAPRTEGGDLGLSPPFHREQRPPLARGSSRSLLSPFASRARPRSFVGQVSWVEVGLAKLFSRPPQVEGGLLDDLQLGSEHIMTTPL